jgi:cytochrome c2
MATIGLAVLIAANAYAADGLDPSCATCHALSRPSDTSLDRLWTRKGPDLWYAGSKFKTDWVVEWLQDPKPIRPAGYPYFKTITEGPDHDVPDPSKMSAHPKLDKASAEKAAAALMKLKAPDDLIKPDTFKGNMSGARMGALAFNKLRGCTSCHEGENGKGGLSGPELTDAGDRLQPDFMAAYIADPQRFDPHIWMPTLGLKDQDIQKLTAYLVQQSRRGKQ